MDWNTFLSKLFNSAAVWSAIIALLNALQKWLLPGMPNDVTIALNLLVVAVAGVFGVVISAMAGRNVAIQKAAAAERLLGK